MRTVSRKPSEAAPTRLGALAKLPVFLDLAGKRAVIAGGSAPAAWKAELVAAAGAEVHVHASEVGPEMAVLLERGAAAGQLVHHAEAWSEAALEGAAIAFADAEDDEEGERFQRAARRAGALVNVIDKPEHCQFLLGSIVNRSPVVVAISTDGAAPVIGQAIRRRIETLLPPTLAAWGRLAKSVRAEVAQRLAPGVQRRTFWERLAERAFGREGPGEDARESVAELIGEVAGSVEQRRGRVTLVGAGPGDAELLTLKAMRALQSADVILYDDLVSDDVLELARREAKRMCVGKRGHRDSCRQGDIEDLMVRLAHEGRQVVRLKAGDVAIFGRAGEEIERLEREGIAFEVVPGITAASAMAARLGISLTHRSSAHSVRFVTGHAASGELDAGLDWRGLADPDTSLIVYMGARTSGAIAARLMSEGLPGDTPVTAVAGVSRTGEWRWRGTLAQLGPEALAGAGKQPMVIGIGRVFASADVASEVVEGVSQVA
ncbi:MAG: uroporphyrinogen-III C-methyltransferase [Proteobacteria bacterium]|nr:uroporphyrinogen-III C-methyltransferase [Pseudomonadota bacterium]